MVEVCENSAVADLGVGLSGYDEVPTTAADGDEVPHYAAGEPCKGEFRCADCEYGVTVYRELPICPMCGCESWQSVLWSPMAHAQQASPPSS
jgi:hypothetical protein